MNRIGKVIKKICKYLIFVILAFIVFILGFIAITFLGWHSSPTTNMVVEIIESPDGEYVAYVFIRDLGATTSESYQLSILKTGKNINRFTRGNVYRADHSFNIEWTGDKELTVIGYSSTDIYKQEESLYDIIIKYE